MTTRARAVRCRADLGCVERQTKVTKDRPVDATVMAIVDQVEMAGEQTYNK